MLSHAIVGGAVGAICVLMVLASLYSAEDRVYRSLVEAAARSASTGNEAGAAKDTWPQVRLFGPRDALPPRLAPIVEQVGDGAMELDGNRREQHVAVRHDDAGRRFVALGEFPETGTVRTLPWLALIVAVGAAAGWAYGLFQVRRALRPATRLADALAAAPEDVLRGEFTRDFADDEIGAIANRLQEFVRRHGETTARQQRFVRDASHELRTPLSILRGVVDLLRDDPEARAPRMAERTARMDRSIRRMQHTVESLLWLARLENEAEASGTRDLAIALADLVDELRGEATPGVEVTLDLGQDLALPGPRHLWTIVVRNLVENALHHTTAGAVTVVVRNGEVRVADTGSGIPPALQRAITRDWVQGAHAQGFGLGLSITHRIAQRVGWHLSIDSALGRGTTVRVARADTPVDAANG